MLSEFEKQNVQAAWKKLDEDVQTNMEPLLYQSCVCQHWYFVLVQDSNLAANKEVHVCVPQQGTLRMKKTGPNRLGAFFDNSTVLYSKFRIRVFILCCKYGPVSMLVFKPLDWRLEGHYRHLQLLTTCTTGKRTDG